MKKLWVLLLAFTLVACSKKIDGTDMESFDASLKAIARDMSAEEAKAFRTDLNKAGRLIGKNQNLDAGQTMLMAMSPQAQARLTMENLHGKTASDVRKMAKEWDGYQRQQEVIRLKKNVENIKVRITELEHLKEGWDKVQMSALKVSIVNVSDLYGRVKWIWRGTVTNGSKAQLVRARFELPEHSAWEKSWRIDTDFFKPPLDPGQSRQLQVTMGLGAGGRDNQEIDLGALILTPVELETEDYFPPKDRATVEEDYAAAKKNLADHLARIKELDR